VLAFQALTRSEETFVFGDIDAWCRVFIDAVTLEWVVQIGPWRSQWNDPALVDATVQQWVLQREHDACAVLISEMPGVPLGPDGSECDPASSLDDVKAMTEAVIEVAGLGQQSTADRVTVAALADGSVAVALDGTLLFEPADPVVAERKLLRWAVHRSGWFGPPTEAAPTEITFSSHAFHPLDRQLPRS
jgi:hypothetical protein